MAPFHNLLGDHLLWSTIRTDAASQMGPEAPVGLTFWLRVCAKAIASPAVHVVIIFRVSHLLAQHSWTRPLAFLLRAVTVVWGGTEIHPDAQIGPGLCLVHSQKVIIGGGVRVGSHARIYQGVTLAGDPGRGSVNAISGWPVLGDRVTIGTDALIMGPVRVGDDAVVGAQSLVIHDVPPGATAVGSPARVVARRSSNGGAFGSERPKGT